MLITRTQQAGAEAQALHCQQGHEHAAGAVVGGEDDRVDQRDGPEVAAAQQLPPCGQLPGRSVDDSNTIITGVGTGQQSFP